MATDETKQSSLDETDQPSSKYLMMMQEADIMKTYNLLHDPVFERCQVIDIRAKAQFSKVNINGSWNIQFTLNGNELVEKLKNYQIMLKRPLLFIIDHNNNNNNTNGNITPNSKLKAFIANVCDILESNNDRLNITNIYLFYQPLETFYNKYPFYFTDYKAYPSQIMNDKLFLGDIRQAKSLDMLKNLEITHIVNCSNALNVFENIDINTYDSDSNGININTIANDAGDDEKKANNDDDNNIDKKYIKYYQIKLEDSIDAGDEMYLHFDKCIKFIENAIGNKNNNNDNSHGNKVLIHCMAGVSRSATITIAYLMKTQNMTSKQAADYVIDKRSIVYPNRGFCKALKKYEKDLMST